MHTFGHFYSMKTYYIYYERQNVLYGQHLWWQCWTNLFNVFYMTNSGYFLLFILCILKPYLASYHVIQNHWKGKQMSPPAIVCSLALFHCLHLDVHNIYLEAVACVNQSVLNRWSCSQTSGGGAATQALKAANWTKRHDWHRVTTTEWIKGGCHCCNSPNEIHAYVILTKKDEGKKERCMGLPFYC